MSVKEELEMLTGCDHAVSVILKGFEHMCGGFILTPCEVTNLLGIKKTTQRWHLHPKVGKMQRELAQHCIGVEVNASQGCVFVSNQVDHPRHRKEHVLLGEEITFN